MLSIEAFAATNLMMNLLILMVSARCMGYIKWRRVLSAAVLGTVYAVAAYAWIPVLRGAAGQTVCLLAMAAILFRGGRRGRRWRGLMHLAGGAVFAGGVMTLLSRWIPAGSPGLTAVGWLIITGAAFLNDGFRSGDRADGCIRLRISTRMGSAEVEALVDTGNRLRETLSGLPVVIVGRRCLRGVLDESCLYASGGRLPPGFRLVRYGVLGGEGEMHCFRPESVCVWRGTRWEEGPDVWIGVYPGELASDVDALTPPVFGRRQRL